MSTKEAKISYGTGCFLIAPIGSAPRIDDTLITTILSRHKGQVEYGFECSVECGGGTINWAKRTGLFDHYHELNNWLDSLQDELFFLPSFG